jgi:hypothetical protein
MSDFDAGLAEGYRRGYQAAMDAVALEQQTESGYAMPDRMDDGIPTGRM